MPAEVGPRGLLPWSLREGQALWGSGEALNPLPRCKPCCKPRAAYPPLRSVPTMEGVHKAPTIQGAAPDLGGPLSYDWCLQQS